MKKQFLSALLAALMTFSLAACQKGGGGRVNIPANQIVSEDFQKNMHQSTASNLRCVCETEEGIYFQWDSYAYYLEKETKRATILCNKPECAHNDRTCNAWLNASGLCLYDGGLYFKNGDRVTENGQSVDYGDRLYRVDADGTNRRVVQDLELVPGGDALATTYKEPLLHRGITYFSYSGVLYSLPLGGDVKDAKKIWGEEIENDGSMYFDPNAPSFTLWADGDFIYFMVNLEQPDGTCKDTLFAYDTTTGEAARVWEVPGADAVGRWETTGVSVSQWYVIDGCIFFYLSGGDFWRSSLETGETVKLADVSEKTASGSAVFSDDYLCVLNDAPHTDKGLFDASDATGRIGGDTFYIYDLEGNLQKELSVGGLYDELDDLLHIQPILCSGNEIYFLANAVSASGSASTDGGITSTKRSRSYTLCCVNIETGEITQIYNW